MKNKLHLIPLYLFSFGFIILMSSYSVDYSRIDSRDDGTKISQKDQRRNLRMEQRKSRLENRLNKSKKQVQRQRIQKKIRMIKEKQKNNSNGTAVGIVGMVMSILSVILFLVFLVFLLYGALYGLYSVPVLNTLSSFFSNVASYLLFASIITAIVGLVTSIFGRIFSKRNPGKGLSTAGIIIGSIMCGILGIVLLLLLI
ncbi:MAG: hypothetical protein MK207_11425 [Saprospiraceae bacterium]|nr:hypothetical protein [Saprospiraceae bacterium]